MNINKKPYEISLWDEKLQWVRRPLIEISVAQEQYEPGKFLSDSNLGKSSPNYTYDYADYDKSKKYYTIDKNSTLIKEGSEKDIVITADDKDWYNKGVLVPNTIFQYYREERIATIGSNLMETPARCINPKLTRKVNGENVLSFTLYYQYIDPLTGKKEYNPFNQYMVNERKIKLRIGEPGEGAKWYDFIIKQIQENSETKAFTYTCKDQFVNELSKTGFEIVLDNELENNMGTVEEIADTVLEGSDWRREEGDILKQYVEEPLYELVIERKAISSYPLSSAKNFETNRTIDWQWNNAAENTRKIYVFYSQIANEEKNVQFLYSPNGIFSTNEDLVIDKTFPNYVLSVNYDANGVPSFVAKNAAGEPQMTISDKYRGFRLVKQYKTTYDKTIDKYVNVYRKTSGSSTEYYGYKEDIYVSSATVKNYVTNSSEFTGTEGWVANSTELKLSLESVQQDPKLPLTESSYRTFLVAENTSSDKTIELINFGISGYRSFIKNFQIGETYMCRMKCYKTLNYGDINGPSSVMPEISIGFYETDKGQYILKEEDLLFSFDEGYEDDILLNNNNKEDHYSYFYSQCAKSVSEKVLTDLHTRIGIFIKIEPGDKIYIEDIQIFPMELWEGKLIVPDSPAVSQVKTQYVIYKPDPNLSSIKDLIPVFKGEQLFGYEQVCDDKSKFYKVRSISAKESNRFNIIQKLCETFECWADLRVERNLNTGEILYGKDLGETDPGEAYRQQKFISFKEFIGQENQVGFKYGINSKSIQRTLDSAAIVSKMIVKDNANEFAPNGFCSIARAPENPVGENFLLNFDHYIRQQMLNFSVVTNDLYLDTNGYMGYYKILKRLNADRDKKIDLQSGLLADISEYSSSYTTYKSSYDAAFDRQKTIEKNIMHHTLSEGAFADKIEGLVNDEVWKNDEKFQEYWAAWCRCQTIINQHKPFYEQAKQKLDESEAEYNRLQSELNSLTDKKRALGLKFYKKYSRFIQEGSWIKEDYIDPNLYYLDSISTLHTSSQPKVSYDIKVIDVSSLEGYEDYQFRIGDKTTIEDVEFFGWSLKDRKTPYKEEVVISEIIIELDSPEKNQIKVQNYKTQFEDLFQRITAQTQQAEYHTGEYNRAASVVDSKGVIKPDTLQNSFANNALILQNAKDQSVIWDESGITTTSLTNPSQMVRIVSGGVFLSTDGGISWKTGVTGEGINTSYLTAGQINTNEIYIMNGDMAAFRWDHLGLSAFGFDSDVNDYVSNKYVRFDQYGLYGIKNQPSDWNPKGVDDIIGNANFALTWKGFYLKNNHGDNGYISIDPDEDFSVYSNGIQRIKIGLLEQNTGDEGEQYNYGIRIKDDEGNTVLETDEQGKLWLRDALWISNEDDSSQVKIGKLKEYKTVDEINYHEVIHAGKDKRAFIVYEDGSIKATYGTIGNLDIQAIEDTIDDTIESIKKLEISAPFGYNFQIDANGTVSPSTLKFIITNKNFNFAMSGDKPRIDAEISTNQGDWGDISEKIHYDEGNYVLEINYEDFQNPEVWDPLDFQLSTWFIKITAFEENSKQPEEGKCYEENITIHVVQDGTHPIVLEILSEDGDVYINQSINTILTATIRQNGVDKTAEYLGDGYSLKWFKKTDAGEEEVSAVSGYPERLSVTSDMVTRRATFTCRLYKSGVKEE